MSACDLGAIIRDEPQLEHRRELKKVLPHEASSDRLPARHRLDSRLVEMPIEVGLYLAGHAIETCGHYGEWGLKLNALDHFGRLAEHVAGGEPPTGLMLVCQVGGTRRCNH